MTTLKEILAEIANDFKSESNIELDIPQLETRFAELASQHDLSNDSDIIALAEVISIELDREYDL